VLYDPYSVKFSRSLLGKVHPSVVLRSPAASKGSVDVLNHKTDNLQPSIRHLRSKLSTQAPFIVPGELAHSTTPFLSSHFLYHASIFGNLELTFVISSGLRDPPTSSSISVRSPIVPGRLAHYTQHPFSRSRRDPSANVRIRQG
jgi:hypothetical protein